MVNGFIKKSEIKGSDLLEFTEKGYDYKRKLDSQFYKKLKIWGGIPTVLGAIISIVIFLLPYLKKPHNNEYIDKPSALTEAKDSTFLIKNGYLYNELIESIEQKSGYINSVSSKRIFEITYSDGTNQIRENYFVYPGGYLILKYDGEPVFEFYELKIEKTNPDGTLKNVLIEELNRRVSSIVKNNYELFSKEIISTLNK